MAKRKKTNERSSRPDSSSYRNAAAREKEGSQTRTQQQLKPALTDGSFARVLALTDAALVSVCATGRLWEKTLQRGKECELSWFA